MFCHQCSQSLAEGCTKTGICGKNEDLSSIQDTLTIGLKGLAVYGYHAKELGASDPEVDSFVHEALFSTVTNVNFDPGRFVKLLLKCGEMNLRTMDLLDKAHTQRFGNPIPSQVSTGTRKGHAVLVTGHSLLEPL